MRYRQYKFKFYLNSHHYIYTNGSKGELHPHSWEIVLYLVKARQDFVSFAQIEKAVEGFFDKYQDKTLNDFAPFDTINPTLENVAEFFKDHLAQIANELGWILIMIEMSETPSRSYIISLLDDIELSENQSINTYTDLILENVRKKDLNK